MITLKVRRDRKGNIILRDKSPKGVRLVFPVTKPLTDLDKRLRTMWNEFDQWVDTFTRSESDELQQNKIKRLAKKHFGVDLTWPAVPHEYTDVNHGWPTDGRWRSNKTWFNREIKRLVKGMP